MKTITKTVYNVTELSEKAFEKAYRGWVSDFDFWIYQDDIINAFMEEHNLSGKLFNYVYRGFYSQGYGGRFEFESLYGDDLKPFVKHVYKTTAKRDSSNKYVAYAIDNNDLTITQYKNRFGYRYSYEKGVYLDYYYNGQKEDIIKEFVDGLQDYFEMLSKKLYYRLQEAHEDLTSRDSFKEYCDVNELYFNNFGDIE